MQSARLNLSRKQILAYRRHVGGLESRAKIGKRSIRRVAWAGLQDSMPRAAVLSMHARLEGVQPLDWGHPELIQVWGPRYSVYAVPRQDVAVFTLGRLPGDARGRERAYGLATELAELLGDQEVEMSKAGKLLGHNPNRLRYATTTGTIRIRWDGARQPTIATVAGPDIDPNKAQDELARRYLHIFGPSTPAGFARWAGVNGRAADATFARLGRSLTAAVTPIGEGWLLSGDVDTFLTDRAESEAVRLLPSGDAYYLLHDSHRSLLVPKTVRREQLWTSRVWPGALLAGGEIVGTWRRSKNKVMASPWKRLSARGRHAVETEAASLPLPDDGEISVEWDRD